MLEVKKLKDVLKSRGMRATSQRIAVHEAMLKLVHASADQVADHIATHSKVKVTTTSVYNILSQFTLMGIYRNRLSSDNKMYFDVNTDRHVHLYDRVYGEYRDLQEEEILQTIEKYFRGRRFRGYKFEQADLTLICHPTRRRKDR